MWTRHPWLVWCVLWGMVAGCAAQVPYVGQGPYPQLERGRPNIVVDTAGNILALPFKLLFLDWRFANHAVSSRTEEALVRYVNDHPELQHVHIRLNQYAPQKDFKRLLANRQVAWPYRATFGVLGLLVETIIPGRLFAGLLTSDLYDPWTDTVHIYSDRVAIGLHELGHADDFIQQPYKGTYGLARMIPVVTLHQEWRATDEAIGYLIEIGDRRNEMRAYRVLYPALGSYVGGYLLPLGGIPGILVGHVAGAAKVSERTRFYREFDARTSVPNP